MNLDRMIAVAAVGAYATAVLAFLPPNTYVHMLGGGLFLFAVVAAVARLFGTRSTHAFSILAVSFIGGAVLAMPNFPAMGGQHRIAVPIGFLGSQAAALLWIALRWTADPHPKPRAALLLALFVGLLGALALSVIASIPIGIGLLAGDTEAMGMLWVYPAYFAGALSAAFLYWIFQGIAHRPVGRYFLGVLGGFCLYTAMGPVVAIVDREPIDLPEMVVMGLVLGCLVGPPVAMSWNSNFAS